MRRTHCVVHQDMCQHKYPLGEAGVKGAFDAHVGFPHMKQIDRKYPSEDKLYKSRGVPAMEDESESESESDEEEAEERAEKRAEKAEERAEKAEERAEERAEKMEEKALANSENILGDDFLNLGKGDDLDLTGKKRKSKGKKSRKSKSKKSHKSKGKKAHKSKSKKSRKSKSKKSRKSKGKKSSGGHKQKFYPKRSKSCKERHMNWNPDSKRCSKKH